MSLACRIANTLTTGQATQFATPDSHDLTHPFTVQEPRVSQNISLHGGTRKEYATALEEEEEARPPYLHVRP